MTLMRRASDPWIWANPTEPIPPYAVMRWKGGALYAGPAESTVTFPPALVDGATMMICDRAEALRHAVNSKVEA